MPLQDFRPFRMNWSSSALLLTLASRGYLFKSRMNPDSESCHKHRTNWAGTPSPGANSAIGSNTRRMPMPSMNGGNGRRGPLSALHLATGSEDPDENRIRELLQQRYLDHGVKHLLEVASDLGLENVAGRSNFSSSINEFNSLVNREKDDFGGATGPSELLCNHKP